MTAVLPASFFQQVQPGAITVTNPSTNQTTASVAFTIIPPNIQVVFTGSGTVAPGAQPALDLQLLEGYPFQLQVTLTLSVQPTNTGGPTDPNVQFSTGGTVETFTLPANSTTVPQIMIQTGTLSGTITVNLTLEQNGQNVTPGGIQPVVINVPPVAPVITSVLVSGSGSNLTVTIQGYSSTRDMSTADFTFTPAVSGFSLATPQVSVDVGAEFATWYAEAESLQFGSAFLYTQTFDLSSDSSAIGSVSVTLTNSAGTSLPVTATN